jgi:hypothetical protein
MSNFIKCSPNKGKYIANTFMYLTGLTLVRKHIAIGLGLSQVMLPPTKREGEAHAKTNSEYLTTIY